MIGENYKKTPKDVMIGQLISAETIADEGVNSLFDLIIKEIDSWLMKDGYPENDKIQEWLKSKMFSKNVNIYYKFEKGSLTTEPVPDGTYLLGKEYLNKMKNCKQFLGSFSSELKDIGGGVNKLNFKVDELKLKNFIKSRMVTMVKNVAKKIILLSGEELAPKEFSESFDGITSFQFLSENELLKYFGSIFFTRDVCRKDYLDDTSTLSQFFSRVENSQSSPYQKYLTIYQKLLSIFEESFEVDTSTYYFDGFSLSDKCKELLVPKTNHFLYLFNFLPGSTYKKLFNKTVGGLFDENNQVISFTKLADSLKRIYKAINFFPFDEQYCKLIWEVAFQPFEYKEYKDSFVTSLAEFCPSEILDIKFRIFSKGIDLSTPTIDFDFIKVLDSDGFSSLQKNKVDFNKYYKSSYYFRFVNDNILLEYENTENYNSRFLKGIDKFNLKLDMPVDFFVSDGLLENSITGNNFPTLLKLIQEKVDKLYVSQEQISQYQLALQMLQAGLLNTFVSQSKIECSIELLKTILQKSSETKEDS